MANKIAINNTSSRLEDLIAITEKLSIEIEYSNLSDNEIAVQSGYCKYNGKEIIILDKNLPLEFQISIILKILGNFNLDDIYIASWIREHFESEKSS
jgi:hypothetical protein